MNSKNNDYEQIYDCFGDFESNLIKTKLESNGIEVATEGLSRNITYGIGLEKEGTIKLFVNKTDVHKAKQIVNEFIHEEGIDKSVKGCPYCRSLNTKMNPLRKIALFLTLITFGIMFCLIPFTKKYN